MPVSDALPYDIPLPGWTGNEKHHEKILAQLSLGEDLQLSVNEYENDGLFGAVIRVCSAFDSDGNHLATLMIDRGLRGPGGMASPEAMLTLCVPTALAHWGRTHATRAKQRVF